jgi:branched-chain amino acid aminotransferase
MSIYEDGVSEWISRNGQVIPWEDATIHVNSVGHASVAGVFEGIKAFWSEADQELYLFRLEEHVKRFLASIRMVRYGFEHDGKTLEELIRELLRKNRARHDMYVRPYVFQAGLVRELLQPEPGKPTELIIDCWPFTSYRDPEDALDVCVSSWTRISDNVLPPRLKCFSNYHNGRLAAMEATVSGYDWPILLDGQGKVTEGPGACLALVRDGVVLTPPITGGILESITRHTVGVLVSEKLGLQFVERTIDRTELYLADELFFIGTGWGIMPVRSVDRLAVGDGHVGKITKDIQRAYDRVTRGGEERYRSWLTPVWEGETAN